MSDPSQSVDEGLTPSAIFLTLSVKAGDEPLDKARGFFGELPSLVKAVGFRDAQAKLSCVLGIGFELWQRLGAGARPAGLHPFQEIHGVHHAPATPGDILLHIRAVTLDYCFELATHIMHRLDGAVRVDDETQGFKFFDNRDLLGFVDGTENPTGQALHEAVRIGAEDPAFTGGSYVIVQKYLHDMPTWNALPVEQQERIIGRHKLSDIEQQDDEKASYAHNVLTKLEDDDGNDLEILRDNMPFGSPARGEFGTYFIGYAREPGRIERMLNNMFIGDPPGNYDRLLDVSVATTGALFYIPTLTQLEALAAGEPIVAPTVPQPNPQAPGSLGLGSLRQGPKKVADNKVAEP